MAKTLFLSRFRWLSALPLLLVTAALTLIALSALAGAQSTDSRSRAALFDFFQRVSPLARDAGDSFHIIEIDRESTEAIGPWPWPRTLQADLVQAAADAGVKGVVLAEPVDAPDPLSPETIGEFWLNGARDEALARQLDLLPRTDEVLAAAFQTTPGAVAISAEAPADPHREAALQRTDLNGAEWLSLKNSAGDYAALPAARIVYRVNSELRAAAQPSVSALYPDSDSIVRRAPLLWSVNGAPAPSVALEAAHLAADGPVQATASTSTANALGQVIDAITVGGRTTPLSSNATMRFSLPQKLSLQTTSAVKLLDNRGANSQLNDKVVLIGLDEELGGALRTARGRMAPVKLHALLASQIAAGKSAVRPAWSGYLEALAVMLLGAAAIMTAQRMQFWQALGFAGLVSIILLLGAFAAFTFSDILLDPLPAALALFLGAFSIAGGKSITGVLRDDNLRGAFHDTLPETTMKVIREDIDTDILTGARRPVTVLACELRLPPEDLRTLENLPEEVSAILAAASLDLRQTIIDTGGAADQAEGGRMFAYYNAPMEAADHVQAGCAAALRLVESMDKINADLETSSRTKGLQLHLAIGVATGDCFVGPMGHGRNNRYSAIGRAVDLAAFLRSQSEIYGPAMIVDEGVYRETHHHFAYLELDKLATRHAERPISIYALVGNPFIKSSKGFRALDNAHREFLKSYRAGDLAAAREMLTQAKKSPGAKIALFDIYEERLQTMIENGAPKNWNGVHAARI